MKVRDCKHTPETHVKEMAEMILRLIIVSGLLLNVNMRHSVALTYFSLFYFVFRVGEVWAEACDKGWRESWVNVKEE